MAINLKSLYEKSKKKYKLECLAGENELEQIVSWVHYLEDITTTDFIRGSELIITTGMSSKGEDWLKNLIMNLIRDRAAGIIVNVGNYIQEVPEQIIEMCEKEGFPLFTMPWEIHLVDITHDFCNRILKEKQEHLDVLTNFRKAIFAQEEVKTEVFEDLGYSSSANFIVTVLSDEKLKELSERQRRQELIEKMELLVNRCTNDRRRTPCVFIQEGHWIVIISSDRCSGEEQFSECLNEEIKRVYKNHKMKLGMSSTKKGVTELSGIYKQALNALKIAEIKNQEIMLYKDLGIYKILLNVQEMDKLVDTYYEYLGILDSYDRDHKSDYLDTLELYLKHNGSVQEVAKETFMHRNTVNYRMKKIKEVFPYDLEDENIKFMVRLCFYIRDIIKK